MTHETTNWQQTDELLCKEEMGMDAAELHELLTGYICGSGNEMPKIWTEILCHNPIVSTVLQEFYSDIEQSLRSINFEFTLPLPGDSQPLETRAQALVKWVQEFLTGLGLSGLNTDDINNNDIKEGLHDFSDITQLNTNDISNDEEQEQEIVEIIEFCRSVVMYIYAELHSDNLDIPEDA